MSLSLGERQYNTLPASRGIEGASELFIDALRIRLAAGGLHHLTDEKAEGRRTSAAVLRYGVGVSREHAVDERRDFTLVVDLRQPFSGDNLLGRSAGGRHLVEDVLRDGAADLSAFDERDQACQPLRRDRRVR